MTDPAQPTLRIFVSHSHVDNEFGLQLVQDLRRIIGDDSAVWYDEAGGLHGGDSWWDKIVRELTARNFFIVVLSPDAQNRIDKKSETNNAYKVYPGSYAQGKIRISLWQ